MQPDPAAVSPPLTSTIEAAAAVYSAPATITFNDNLIVVDGDRNDRFPEQWLDLLLETGELFQ